MRSIDKMLQIRRYHKLYLIDLIKLKAALNRAKPFIITADYNPASLALTHDNVQKKLQASSTQLALAF